MSLRIGIDLDGVIADLDLALAREADRLFGGTPPETDQGAAADTGPDAESEPASQVFANLSARQRRRLWRHVEAIEDFWESLEESEPGQIARLASIAAERRWEVIFLTKRPPTAGATSQLQSQRWLESKGFRLPSVFVVQGSRGLIAAALDLEVVVDDRPENCADVLAASRAKAILVRRGPKANVPENVARLGITLAGSFAECLSLLMTPDSAEHEPGILGRIMKRLGLSEEKV